MLEIGFGHKIPKLNFVFHWKICLKNLRIKSFDKFYRQKVGKLYNKGFCPLSKKLRFFHFFPFFCGHKFFLSNFLGISFKPDWYPIFVIFESFDVGSLSKTFGSTDQLNFHLFLGTLTQFTHSFLYIILLLSGLLWVRQFMEVVQSYWKKVSVLQNFGQTLSNIKLLLVSISAKSHGFYWVSKVI